MGRVRNVLVISLLAMMTSLTASVAAGSGVMRDVLQLPPQVVRSVEPAMRTPIATSERTLSVDDADTSPRSPSDDALAFNADAQAGDSQPSVPLPPPATSSTIPAVGGTTVDPMAEPRGQAPIGLRIPSIGVDAGVQWVGVDEHGNMKVPSNYTDVAWYQHGPRPGERGNAVINGHLDSTTGTAVFWELSQLQPGDEVIVRTHGDQELRFVVTAIESFKTDDAPLDRIFGSTSERNLNLITCDGTFLRDVREYDQRLVVYTVLAEGQTVRPAG